MTCSGTIGAFSVGNVHVASGTSCVLLGTEVRGGIVVQAGGQLDLAFAQVRGSLEAGDGARVRTDQASIGGNIACEGCVLERLILTPVGGNVTIDGAPDGAFVFGSSIGGSLQIVDSTGSVFLFLVTASSIEGSLKFEQGAGFGLIAGSNAIGGSVQIVESGEHRLLQNQIRRNVQVVGNTGTFPTEIAGNVIGGNLQCEDNDPPPIGSGNTARKKQGQCADL